MLRGNVWNASMIMDERPASLQKPSDLLRPEEKSLRTPTLWRSKILSAVQRGSLDKIDKPSAINTIRLLKKVSLFKLSFVGCVIIPALLTIVYFAFIASEQFSTEARFAVRTAQFGFDREKESRGGVNPGVNNTGGSPIRTPSLAGQEAYVVAAYIRSPAIFEDFPKSLDLQSIFARPEADFLAKLKPNATREELVEYWRSMVEVSVNNISGVVNVSVKAFRPQDTYDITSAIVQASEVLVNRLSERARNDAVSRAEEEVRRHEQLVRVSLDDMRTYRDSQQLINPSSEASSTATLLTTAMGERIRLQSEYFVATRAMSPNAPSALILKSRIDAIEQQIEQLKAKMTGPGDARTISAAISKFEELELRRKYAERLYTMSQDALERARQRAEWQNIYLSVFVPAALPQLALFPERISMSLMISGALVIVWGIFALIAAAVKDHMV